ncbi:thioesterase [Mycolicibacterium confluentis]|uniref:Thioesterase n=1 Tax=Mycolicibacterium confluentis TaxID=28047 RepID=A0A7I7Y4L1_9MYCO|nr:thioesterase [Mycolicibacterium confluentis]
MARVGGHHRRVHYFERLGESRFAATEHTQGAWNRAEQHIAPSLGLLAHAVEQDRDRRRDDRLPLTRLSYDILGTVPIAAVEVDVQVRRPGRSIELVEATMSHAGRAVLVLRVWLMQRFGTEQLAGSSFAPIPSPEDTPAWDMSALWRGGFIASADVRRREVGPGRATAWVRTNVGLLAGETVSPAAAAIGLLDIGNGLAVRADPAQVAFPNIDLTAHLFSEPRGGWLGFDTTVSFGADGLGLTHSVIHDETGPIGSSSQMLTVRPVA